MAVTAQLFEDRSIEALQSQLNAFLVNIVPANIYTVTMTLGNKCGKPVYIATVFYIG